MTAITRVLDASRAQDRCGRVRIPVPAVGQVRTKLNAGCITARLIDDIGCGHQLYCRCAHWFDRNGGRAVNDSVVGSAVWTPPRQWPWEPIWSMQPCQKLVGSWQYFYQKTVQWDIVKKLVAGSCPGAITGVLCIQILKNYTRWPVEDLLGKLLGFTFVFVSILMLVQMIYRNRKRTYFLNQISLGGAGFFGGLWWESLRWEAVHCLWFFC